MTACTQLAASWLRSQLQNLACSKLHGGFYEYVGAFRTHTCGLCVRALAASSQGIWLARSPKVAELPTLVMDLEGNDGRERGEDNTNFERQIALFALATADVLLINIWCHDIGREQGAGKPLLRTIFQVGGSIFAVDEGEGNQETE